MPNPHHQTGPRTKKTAEWQISCEKLSFERSQVGGRIFAEAKLSPAGLYSGKNMFFWTSEEPWCPVRWQKVVKAKEGEVEIHIIPDNHITGRTEYLHVLAERLRACLSKPQTTTMG